VPAYPVCPAKEAVKQVSISHRQFSCLGSELFCLTRLSLLTGLTVASTSAFTTCWRCSNIVILQETCAILINIVAWGLCLWMNNLLSKKNCQSATCM